MAERRYCGHTAAEIRRILIGGTSATEKIMGELLDHLGEIEAAHDARVAELLAANNAEVDRRRAAEAANDFRPTHRHYKGGAYQVLHRAENEADLRAVVVYRDAAGRVWVRDSVDFFTTLPDGRPRFATLMPGEVG